MRNFQMTTGLKISHEILKLIKRDKRLAKVEVSVGCFTNCREVGLTYQVHTKDYKKSFTFCTYEHRNSDQIIINGKDGYISLNGELPYIADSKWQYLDVASYGEYQIASDKLADLILKFHTTGKLK